LKKDQAAYAANIRLIETACKDEPRLNVQHWIDQLRYDDVAIINEAIAVEKQRLQDLDKQKSETGTTQTVSPAIADAEYEIVADTGKVSLGVPGHIDFSSDFKGRTKSMKIELIYACDQGDALTLLFAHLKQYGIKIRQIKETKKKETKKKEEAVF
jgi:hypothetical protein